MKILHCLVLMLGGAMLTAQPTLDDICQRTLTQEKKMLKYPPIQERDILWERRVWREIDVRQKMNQHFTAPQFHFCSLLIEAVKSGQITAYSPEDERFSYPMSEDEVMNAIDRRDTVEIIDVMTGRIDWQVVSESLDPDSIRKIRIKEVWYFDSRHSTLRVRILGIAPVIEVKDEFDNVLFERPLFWLHYPSIRPYLASLPAYIPGNDSHAISWEDQLERRYFAARIYKVSNLKGERISDSYAGLHALEEAFKKEQEIFNFEHDLWSY